jgi:hypothetical protein
MTLLSSSAANTSPSTAADDALSSNRLSWRWLARRFMLWTVAMTFAVGSACALYATASTPLDARAMAPLEAATANMAARD